MVDNVDIEQVFRTSYKLLQLFLQQAILFRLVDPGEAPTQLDGTGKTQNLLPITVQILGNLSRQRFSNAKLRDFFCSLQPFSVELDHLPSIKAEREDAHQHQYQEDVMQDFIAFKFQHGEAKGIGVNVSVENNSPFLSVIPGSQVSLLSDLD